MTYRLVIFDWDGTLLDSTGHIVASMQRAAAELDWRIPADREVNQVIGLSLPEAIRTLFPDIDDDRLDVFRQGYAAHFTDESRDTSRFFEGAPELLQGLHQSGYLLGLATGKARPGLERVWRTFRIGHYFHASRCSDESRSKPHPAMVQELLETLSVPAREAVVVGDTRFDLDMARAAGVDAVGVRYGAHPPELLEQARPRALVDSLHDLKPLLGLTTVDTETTS